MKVDHSYTPYLLHLQKGSLKQFQAYIGFESCVYNYDDNCDNLLPYNHSLPSSHM